MDFTKNDQDTLMLLLSSSGSETAEWFERKAEEIKHMMVYYRCAMMEVETKLKVLNEEFSMKHDRNPINSIKTRLKSFSSIREKMNRRGITITPDAIEESLNDIAGVRVICTFPDDVYAVANALLNQDDILLINEKDYIKNPKPNGYRSLHLIIAVPIFFEHDKQLVKVEIQLRTIAMDFWASMEHQLRYKKDFQISSVIEKELLDCATMSAALDSRMNLLMKSVVNNEQII